MEAAVSLCGSGSGLPAPQCRVVTAEELAEDTRRFAAFQWAIGIGEAQQILSRPEEEPAAAVVSPLGVRLEVKDVGLVAAALDVCVVKEAKGRAFVPFHTGLTMLDEAVCVVDLCLDCSTVSAVTMRRIFVLACLCNLVKEAPIPVFLTDLSTSAVKASVCRGPRGVPLIVYERLSLDAFARELQLAMASKAVAEALKRLKLGWILPLGRCRMPFESRHQGQQSEGKSDSPTAAKLKLEEGAAANAGAAVSAAAEDSTSEEETIRAKMMRMTEKASEQQLELAGRLSERKARN
ncbi:hypothetical protein cyc_05347 [Cyclospora cayetanensis]|uniref:Uncharacterized protein n=1 Tax=Cyclospora cayetanensis TaxID=88456 RepID=A0A1D3CVF1_9EIME|nr:hypothetical protein cyc_05347 [Cyclospora cayetanensis]